MNFEVMESVELDEFTGSNPQIAKGKRTKRRRMALSSSSSGGDGDRKGCIELEEDRNYESTVTTMSSTEEEDEDMANCLMMLARSGSDGVGGFGVVRDDSGKTERKRKLNASRKPAEISAGCVGLLNNNVYECKTCDKAFQSFQALGGHRASHHKKAKVTLADVGVVAQEDVKPNNSIDQIQLMLNNNTAYSTVQPANTKPPFSSSSITHSTKVHQCSICGSAFSSGQALGGHMRRHRAAAVASSIDGNQISSAAAESPHEETPVVVERVLNNNNFLSSLDLNLPAPAEEDHHTKFHQQLFPTGHDNNSSAIVAAAPSCMFSAPPPTVGCYF
ncbi:unnamed protein product [Rhodiola kirilowii]